jgi:hypothetical protein
MTAFSWTLGTSGTPASSPASLSTTFGTDFSTFIGGVPDLDPSFTLIGGPQVVAETVGRRLLTPRGSLPGAPGLGIDLRSYLNEGLTPAKLSQLKAAVVAEATEDERVLSATCSTVFDAAASALRVSITGLTAAGPFTLVLGVSSLTVALLEGTA